MLILASEVIKHTNHVWRRQSRLCRFVFFFVISFCIFVFRHWPKFSDDRKVESKRSPRPLFEGETVYGYRVPPDVARERIWRRQGCTRGTHWFLIFQYGHVVVGMRFELVDVEGIDKLRKWVMINSLLCVWGRFVPRKIFLTFKCRHLRRSQLREVCMPRSIATHDLLWFFYVSSFFLFFRCCDFVLYRKIAFVQFKIKLTRL